MAGALQQKEVQAKQSRLQEQKLMARAARRANAHGKAVTAVVAALITPLADQDPCDIPFLW
jgi:hypothetical protein